MRSTIAAVFALASLLLSLRTLPQQSANSAAVPVAWVAQDTGTVIHMDLALMHEIPGVNIGEWSLAIDYAPVRFRTKNVVVWLPKSAYTYAALFDIHRTVVSHTFSDFFLFSVQTTQEASPPSN